MSRAGYNEDYDNNWEAIAWRGAVASAIRGKRGQAFIKELIAALDAMPEKRLIADDLINNGKVCAIGSVGVARGIDMTKLDAENAEQIAGAFNIAPAMVREIEWYNDEYCYYLNQTETSEDRWKRMREWAEKQLKTVAESRPQLADKSKHQ